MKLILNILSILIIIFSLILVVPASSEAYSAPTLGGTPEAKGIEAAFFGPDCKDCPAMQTPGRCTLGSEGCRVFRPNDYKPTNAVPGRKPIKTGK